MGLLGGLALFQGIDSSFLRKSTFDIKVLMQLENLKITQKECIFNQNYWFLTYQSQISKIQVKCKILML